MGELMGGTCKYQKTESGFLSHIEDDVDITSCLSCYKNILNIFIQIDFISLLVPLSKPLISHTHVKAYRYRT